MPIIMPSPVAYGAESRHQFEVARATNRYSPQFFANFFHKVLCVYSLFFLFPNGKFTGMGGRYCGVQYFTSLRNMCFSLPNIRTHVAKHRTKTRVLDSWSVLSPRVSAELIGRYSFEAPIQLPVSMRKRERKEKKKERRREISRHYTREKYTRRNISAGGTPRVA